MMKEYLILHIAGFLTGYLADLLIGDPHNIPHPVVAVGKLISFLERKLLKTGEEKRSPHRETAGGLLMCVTVVFAVVMLTTLLTFGAYRINRYLGVVIEAVLTCYILAAKSLYSESMKVHDDIAANDLQKARYDLSMIVGRDTDELDEAAVIRAAVETVAENTSDGVIAPLIFTAIGGPVAGMFYKAVNTMDSMVGYRNERYEYFGKCAARLDDVLNFIPSRISALLMILGAIFMGHKYDARAGFKIWRRDRLKHDSPNSAQTESACAGVLGIKLGGPSRYKGVLKEKPFLGNDLRPVEKEDIKRAGKLMFTAEGLTVLIWLTAVIFILIK